MKFILALVLALALFASDSEACGRRFKLFQPKATCGQAVQVQPQSTAPVVYQQTQTVQPTYQVIGGRLIQSNCANGNCPIR